MKPSLTDDEKWMAVSTCEKRYDGLFYYGVKTTGIFCRPSCRAKTPRKENTVYFENTMEAQAAGFRPCKKCRPECKDYDMDRENAQLAQVQIAKSRFDEQYADTRVVSNTIAELGVSKNHFIHLFKQQTGTTPHQYLLRLRIQQAVFLLSKSDQTILQVALSCGFESLSNFYKCFKEQTGQAPAQYRNCAYQ